jgi:hypothetical protein
VSRQTPLEPQRSYRLLPTNQPPRIQGDGATCTSFSGEITIEPTKVMGFTVPGLSVQVRSPSSHLIHRYRSLS